jgi:serine/threonine-protein kinase
VLDYGVDEGRPFIVMELLEGETLRHRLKRTHRLAPRDTARIISHLARAVGRAHELGIVHRDLKPENVFLVQNQDEELAKVLDFGVAKLKNPDALGSATQTRAGTLLGTPHYMSPEQVKGDRVVDHRSDLWALGVMAFECLTGKRPFASTGWGDLVLQICTQPLPVPSELAALPPKFDAWFTQALARDPAERFQSARELADALRQALGIVPSTLPDEGQPTSAESQLRASPKLDHPLDAEPFAATLVASPGSAFTSEPQHDSVTLGPGKQPRDTSEPAVATRELWWFAAAIGCLLIGLVAAFLWLRARQKAEFAEAPPELPARAVKSAPLPKRSVTPRTPGRGVSRAMRERPSSKLAPSASSVSSPPSASAPLPSDAGIETGTFRSPVDANAPIHSAP